MRTTIEIKKEHRARLLELAARRGEKGFSGILAEAIEAYLRGVMQNEPVVRKALRLGGSLSKKEADHLRTEVSKIRESWR